MSGLLDIVIPTFNRSPILHETLTRFTNSINRSDFKDKVSILILDNNSEDSTAEVVKNFAKFSNTSIIKQKCNIGPEKNLYQGLISSRAKWTWVFGDDDVITDNAINYVCEKLETSSNSIDLFFLNYGQLNSDLSQLLSTHVAKVPEDYCGTWTGDNSITNFLGIFDLISFISSVVIKSDLAAKAPDFTRFQSSYDHTASIMAATANSNICILKTGLMYQRQGNQRESNDAAKTSYFSFLAIVLLYNELYQICNKFDSTFFEKLTSKTGIYEPQSEMNFTNTYIWFFEIFVRRSLNYYNQSFAVATIVNSIRTILPIVHSQTAVNYIERQIENIKLT
jgi:glycosyltransferase involved in cell wall biosynthesis